MLEDRCRGPNLSRLPGRALTEAMDNRVTASGGQMSRPSPTVHFMRRVGHSKKRVRRSPPAGLASKYAEKRRSVGHGSDLVSTFVHRRRVLHRPESKRLVELGACGRCRKCAPS